MIPSSPLSPIPVKSAKREPRGVLGLSPGIGLLGQSLGLGLGLRSQRGVAK